MSGATSNVDSEAFTFEVSAPPPGPSSGETTTTQLLAVDVTQADAFSLELSAPEVEQVLARRQRRGSVESSSADVPQHSMDRRHQPREVIRALARICIEGDPPLDTHAVDLSAHGLAVTSNRPLNVGLECRIELGISAPELARPPELRASIRYCARLREDQYRIGMKFTRVSVEAAELIVAVLGL